MLCNKRISSFSKQNRDLHNGETLFEFLKRKKKFPLNEAASAQSNKSCSKMSNTDRHAAEQSTPVIETKRQRSYQRNPPDTYRKNLDNSSNTPRRVQFADNDEKKTNRSFAEMISPLKRKNADLSATPIQISGMKPSILRNPRENYSRRNINEKLLLMRETLQTFITTGKNVKQKAHSLFVEMKPIFRFVEEHAEGDLLRRTDNTKGKLRTFETQFKKFDVDGSTEIIESFHQALSEHINSVEGDLRAQFQRKYIEGTKKMKTEKETRNQELDKENSTLMKQIELLERRLQKSEKAREQFIQAKEDHEEQLANQFNCRIAEYQSKISTLEGEITLLNKRILQQCEREQDLQKKLKNVEYSKQESQNKFREEAEAIKSKREELLLNQIVMLKGEFKKDMAQISELYTVKQSDYIKTIKQLQVKIEEIMHQRKCDKGLQGRFLDEINASKLESSKYKKQNECLITDMHRMNEELYQHWLALKDIRTLSKRIDLYSKVQRIYEDLGFNEFLFA